MATFQLSFKERLQKVAQVLKSNAKPLVFMAVFAVIGTIFLTHSYASTDSVTLFSNTSVPQQIDSDDGQTVEVGMKFKSDIAGTISGVRFYKSAQNTGAHTGSVWSADGKRLATVTFSGESSSGWQQATFSSPLAVTADTTYIVSYHTNVGHYSDTLAGLKAQIDNAPLHTLADSPTSANGVYVYGASAFPKNSWKSTNYWVDVVFKPATTNTTPPPTVPPTPTPPPTSSLGVDQQVSAHPTSNASTITSPVITTSENNELLMAFVTTDGPSKSQGVSVSGIAGGNAIWTLKQRSNTQAGTTEIWQAVAATPQSGMQVKASLSGSFAGSMTIVAFKGADTTIGAVAAANGSSGAPKISLTATRNGSWVWAAGNDYDNAIARTLGTDQVMVDQYLASVGDTYWVQRQATAGSVSGATVTLNSVAPSSDRWNMAAVEILPATATSTPTPTPTPPVPPTTTDTTAPSVPGNVTASAISASQVNLAWSASTDNVGVTGYTVYRNGTKVADVTTASFSDTGLLPKTAYSYYVVAYDAAANMSSTSSVASVSTQASPDTTAPTVPQNIVAKAISPTQVTLTWSASTDSVGVTDYLVLRNNAVIATVGTPGYVDNTVAANTTYSYTIEARDAAGNVSSVSTSASVKTPNPTDTTAPNVPSGVIATVVSQTQVNVSWSPSTDNVAVAGYTVYRNGTKITSVPTTDFGDGTTVANTTYKYTVSAFDGAGNTSAQSIAVSVSTPQDTTPPPASGGTLATSRPNDGSSVWPDFSNTGYSHTPANAGGLGLSAYPGKLTDYQSGMSADKYMGITFPDNSVIAYKHFVGKVGIFGKNLTFVGCLFEGTNPNDNLVQIYTPDKVKFLYSTFKPVSYATPPGNNGTVSSSHTSPGTPFNQSWQLATTMQESVATMDHNDIWGNAGMEIVTGFPGQPSTWTNNYIHDASDTANNVYHHDGIGPQSEGNGGPMIVDHNTIASLGNTNGLALQGSGVYDHISLTNNYISGWGYAVSIGVSNNATNITVTGNIFSAELSELYGPLYGNVWGGATRGSTWRGNLYQARSGDDNKNYTAADNGKYWWPTDGKSHATDYAN